MQISKSLLLAEILATAAHQGQKDKSGKDYILHPRAVAAQVKSETEKIIALLHDVLEDTSVTETSLRRLFDSQISNAVCTITRCPGESYDSYIQRVGQNPLARTVKLADLHHNMDLRRLPEITEKDRRRYEKYKKAEAYLQSLE